ncbi:N-acetylmuramoyl-L-alanine amidase [Sediminibacillus sp. JSM 1682029]|uniref:N-acetylmuramoyl-L-alanine amidase family protein n=1 Tax=Sediminibacillus sp. JSM 1682029 TaxID=3229857 RepID=UPI0035259811
MVKVAIDIGHGADTYDRTGGKGVVVDGKVYEEHDFNSLVGQELDKLLRANNIDTLMIQEPFSPEVGLTQRTNYYNKQDVDLVWSIHANASSSKDASGRCAFYWHTAEDSKRLAKLFVEEVKAAGYSTHGNGLHASKPGSWTNLHICRETNMTAVLTENGFMTNSKEFKLIFGSKQNEYVKAVARIHAKAITRYFNVDFKDQETGEVVKHKPAKKHKTKSSSVSKPKKQKLVVDGVWGEQTTKALQEVLGTVVDGVISNQLHNSVTKMIVSGITFGKGGSMVIEALQRLIGATVDGYLGPNTVRKLQQYLGTPVDGVISDPSMMVKALQRQLNTGKL